jgi:hypothetical protein
VKSSVTALFELAGWGVPSGEKRLMSGWNDDMTARRTAGLEMRLFLLINASFALLLTSGSIVLSDEIPNLDLRPVCRGIAEMASDPWERGGPDLNFNQCIKK